jgi:hypothetical protein
MGIMNGCALTNQDSNTNNNKVNMYSNNDKIIQEDDDYMYIIFDNKKINNEIEIKYSGFSGIDTIYFLEAKEDTEITMNYDSTVEKGKFKLVLINPDNEIETILEGTDQSSKTIKLTKGKYRLRNVGANTVGNIKFSISNNTNVIITEDKK